MRETVWLIERKDNAVFQCPHWYHEEPSGWHWWTMDAHEAKQFESRQEAETFEPYRMIADDPTISITEHMFIGGDVVVKSEREPSLLERERAAMDATQRRAMAAEEKIRLQEIALDDLCQSLNDERAEIGRLKDALNAILASPHGCIYCDSGELRLPPRYPHARYDQGHEASCGFAMAYAILGKSLLDSLANAA